MNPGLWRRELDKPEAKVTPEPVSRRTARQDLRHVGVNEEARPAADWTCLQKNSVGLGTHGKEPGMFSPRVEEAKADHRSSYHNADTESANELRMCGALQAERPENVRSSAVSARSADSEETLRPIVHTPSRKEDVESGEGGSDDLGRGASEDLSVGGCSVARPPRLDRKSIFVAGKKGLGQMSPMKREKPQC